MFVHVLEQRDLCHRTHRTAIKENSDFCRWPIAWFFIRKILYSNVGCACRRYTRTTRRDNPQTLRRCFRFQIVCLFLSFLYVSLSPFRRYYYYIVLTRAGNFRVNYACYLYIRETFRREYFARSPRAPGLATNIVRRWG